MRNKHPPSTYKATYHQLGLVLNKAHEVAAFHQRYIREYGVESYQHTPIHQRRRVKREVSPEERAARAARLASLRCPACHRLRKASAAVCGHCGSILT